LFLGFDLNLSISQKQPIPLYERTGNRFAQPDLRIAKYRVDARCYRN
jgi:hypothetical protein